MRLNLISSKFLRNLVLNFYILLIVGCLKVLYYSRVKGDSTFAAFYSQYEPHAITILRREEMRAESPLAIFVRNSTDDYPS